MKQLSTILLPLLMMGCTAIEPDVPVDDEGNPIPLPGPYDDWLRVQSVSPRGTIPTRPTIRITFNAHLEDDLFIDQDMVWLSSGGIRASGRTTYDFQTRTLVFRPFVELIDGLKYRLYVNDIRFESVTGAPPEFAGFPLYTVSSEVEPEETEEGVVVWPDVRPIFERKCYACHQDPTWQLNPLTPESMVGVRADGGDEHLVVRYDPADSYLMHKIVPDYPLRRHGVQPPVWSDSEPLTFDETAMIQQWIASGAP